MGKNNKNYSMSETHNLSMNYMFASDQKHLPSKFTPQKMQTK